jgi:hypothetical protein
VCARETRQAWRRHLGCAAGDIRLLVLAERVRDGGARSPGTNGSAFTMGSRRRVRKASEASCRPGPIPNHLDPPGAPSSTTCVPWASNTTTERQSLDGRCSKRDWRKPRPVRSHCTAACHNGDRRPSAPCRPDGRADCHVASASRAGIPAIIRPSCSTLTLSRSTIPMIFPSYITAIRSERLRISSRSSDMSRVAVPFDR